MSTRPAAPAAQRPPVARPAVEATRRQLFGDQAAAKPAPAPATRPAPAPAAVPKPAAAAAPSLADQVQALRADVAIIQGQLGQLLAARQAQHDAATSAPAGPFQDFTATTVRKGISEINGEVTYKAVGHPFTKFGVRIWPEKMVYFLDALEVGDPEELVFGDNPLRTPLLVRAEMGDRGPKKIIGPAPTAMPAAAADEEIPF